MRYKSDEATRGRQEARRRLGGASRPSRTWLLGVLVLVLMLPAAADSSALYDVTHNNGDHRLDDSFATGSTLDFQAYASNAAPGTAFYADDASIVLA